MKKKRMMYRGIVAMLLVWFAIVSTRCFVLGTKGQRKVYKRSYVDRISSIDGTLSVGRQQSSESYLDSSTFYCKEADGKLASADVLGFGVGSAFVASQKHITVFGDDHYNRHVPLESWLEEGYYFPCRPVYARI